MKKILLQLILGLGLSGSAMAIQVNLYVDAAPNVYGSPNYASWWDNAKTTAANGTFVNMANSSNPANGGTTAFEISDAVVYSFGDLGKRLSFIYWVPGTTISELQSKHFQINFSYYWDGVFYDDYYGAAPNNWVTPGSWTEYNGGVIGLGGFAWWGAYGVNTQAALNQDLADWDPYQGNVIFSARMDGEATTSLTATHGVPDAGSTIGFLGSALVGLGFLRRKLS